MANIKFAKDLLAHPDKDDIISRLSSGHSAKDIAVWIRTKYIKNPELCLSEKNLKEFGVEYLDFYKIIANDVKSAKQIIATNPEDVEKELSKTVKGNSKYKERIAELAENKINVRDMLIRILSIVEDRIADIYENMTSEHVGKPDYIMIQYFNTLSLYIEKYFKYIEEKPDHVIQHNVSIEHADKRFSILQEAIRDTLSELDLEVSLQFMPKLQEKLAQLQFKDTANNNELNIDDKSINEDLQKILGS